VTREVSHGRRGEYALAVVVAWEGEGESWDLVFLSIGYALAIWLAHSFANVVSAGPDAKWRAALAREMPVMVGAVPVVVLGALGELFGWTPETVELLALISLAVMLAAVQIVLLKSAPVHKRRLGSTVLLDLIAFVVIVLLLVAVH
jgi:hypothetical protein